ncbi:MAG TPA: YceI family protein [Candidatus Limnocylindrales bacterium]|nr:YceI family protein [Candidatus Limnocylindrales bacterium]
MRSRTAVTAIVAILLLALGGGAVAYVLFLKGDDVAPLALPSAAASAGSGTPAAGDASSGSGTSLPPASAPLLDAARLPGTWTIGAGSTVGYRVRERLASLSADSDAVGRTSGITGTATIASSGGSLSVTAAAFTVDMTSLASDRPMRDNRLRSDGIQTDQFPTSRFTLTQSVALPPNAAAGAAFNVTLHGNLTLHGVTRPIDLPASARLSGNTIQVAGSYSFPFSDFQINPPNIGGFVAVEDHGTLEFLVMLTRS